MEDEGTGEFLKMALVAAGAFLVWKFVLPKVNQAQRRISEASLRLQYILSGLRDAQDAQARYADQNSQDVKDIAARVLVLKDKQAKLQADYAKAYGGAAIPALDLNDTAVIATYRQFLDANGWKDPYLLVSG